MITLTRRGDRLPLTFNLSLIGVIVHGSNGADLYVDGILYQVMESADTIISEFYDV